MKIQALFKTFAALFVVASVFMSCEETVVIDTTIDDYTGTAAVTQGVGTTTTSNLFAQGQRVSPLGTVTDNDNNTWTVPGTVNFTDNSFPTAPDLYNPYGDQYNNAAAALAAFDANDIVEIDAGGELITAYLFADNYFELYVNGVPVGKDAVPFTQFNSHIVQFRVNRPFTAAIKLVDWEENIGIGTEAGGGATHHPGDGGLIAVFEDENQNIIATTGSEWKAQVFYIAPIKDVTCPVENGALRTTADCDDSDSNDGSAYYALHWEIPSDWMQASFDDSDWPSATVFTDSQVGGNHTAYNNFTDIFDDASDDAEFIWSTNLVLDNEVIVRYTVQ